MTEIEAKEIFLKDLFSSKFLFNIPTFQRPFSWEEAHFDTLFEDLYNSMNVSDDNYFLGSVILQTKERREDGSGIYDIIDGQQRITSLIILLAVIRDLIDNTKMKETIQQQIYQEKDELLDQDEEVRLMVKSTDRRFFKENVLIQGSTLEELQCEPENLTQEQIIDAIDLFHGKFGELEDNQNKVIQMAKFVLNKCILVYVRTINLTSAFRLFTVLNTRGLSLSTADLLKVENLEQINAINIEEYSNIWEKNEEKLGREEFEDLIGYIRTIQIKEKARKSIYEEYKNKIFQKGKMIRGKEFVKYLNRIAGIYYKKIALAELAEDSNFDIRYHNLISLMRDYLKFNEWIPPFLLFCEKYSEAEFQYKLLEVLERRVIVDWITGLSPTRRRTSMYQILRMIEESSSPQEILQSEAMSTKTDKKAFMEEIFSSEFYRNPAAKYILLRIDFSFSDNQNVKKIYSGTITIEHILPLNPGENSEWNQIFSDDEKEEYTDSIANLVLLNRRKNSSANNRNFSKKKETYYKGGISDFEITKQIVSCTQWDTDSIQKRKRELKRIVKSLWIC